MSYFNILLVGLLFAFANGAKYEDFNWEDLPRECGKTTYSYSEHTKDNIARIGDFPWLARIGLYDDDTRLLFFYCTGSLIHTNYVITAAHCGMFSKIVRLGETNIVKEVDCFLDTCAPPPQDIVIKKHIFAEHCRLTNVNDLSLLVLETPAELNDFVKPICIPRHHLDYKELLNQYMVVAGWSVIYSGWGTVHGSNFTPGNNLRYASATVLEPEYCDTFYNRNLEGSQLCVGHKADGTDPCVVDSGGPLVRYSREDDRIYIVGVASQNIPLCENSELNSIVYTNVADFGDWILLAINQWIKWQS